MLDVGYREWPCENAVDDESAGKAGNAISHYALMVAMSDVTPSIEIMRFKL